MRFPVRFRQALWGLLGIVLFPVAQVAHASASLLFGGVVRTINTGGSITLSLPSALVVGPSGNIFIADTNNNQVVKVNAQGNASVLTMSGLVTSLPECSVGHRNGCVRATSTSRIRATPVCVKVTSSGAGSVIGTGSVTLTGPHGVALDQSGDLFISDGTGGSSQIVEVTSGGTAAALHTDHTVSPALNTPQRPGRGYIRDPLHR